MANMIGTWRMALEGIEAGDKLLKNGASAQEALIRAVTEVENCRDYMSVGYGGLPNKDGAVQLDAAFMDGDSLRFGAVGAMENFKNPVIVAVKLSQERYNNFLVGGGAEKYALEMGLEKTKLLTDEAKEKWSQKLSDISKDLKAYDGHDTVGVLCMDASGKLCAGTSTSGLFMKHSGRVGDSPIIGSGFYADSQIGAAAATGLGEHIMRGLVSYEALQRVKNGMSPGDACQSVVMELTRKLKESEKDVGDISMILLDKHGNWGIGTNAAHFSFVVSEDDAVKVYLAREEKGEAVIEPASGEWIRSHTE